MSGLAAEADHPIPQSDFPDPLKLAVHYLPQFVAESDLADSTVVVVDLLRASTTICHALSAGAKSVVPCVELADAWAKAESYDRSAVLLGGERGGERIEGFDLGNSPAEYTADQVFNRKVLFTTTNGTKALAHARLARQVLIGATTNRRSLVATIANHPEIDILCAGTGGKVTREDVLAAGSISAELVRRTSAQQWETNEWAAAAIGEWEELVTLAQASSRTVSDQFALELRDTIGGRNLLAIGQDADLPLCAQLDVLDVVPALDQATGEIGLL